MCPRYMIWYYDYVKIVTSVKDNHIIQLNLACTAKSDANYESMFQGQIYGSEGFGNII